MDPLVGVGLFAAAFAAGAVNAVAGGGSLISFPALLAAGLPSKAANVTNTVALWPGYLGGSYAYRAELGGQRRRAVLLSVPSIFGAIAGSALLLGTPESAFESVVPWLILFAVVLMATQDRLAGFALRHRIAGTDAERVPVVLDVAAFALAVYGAYFGAGLGILSLAVLSILLPDDLQSSNALKGLLSLVINAVAVAYFAAFGPVEWPEAAVMAVGALAGGYGGVGVARRLGKRWLRLAVIVYGLVVAVALFVG